MDPKKYKQIESEIREILIKNDPLGLIDGGAPEDEYDCIIPKLIHAANTVRGDESLAKLVRGAFIDHFGSNSIVSESAFGKIASHLRSKWPDKIEISKK